MFRPSDNHLAYFRTFPCVDVQNCTISDTKTAVVPVHEATFRVGGTDFGVLNDDVFNFSVHRQITYFIQDQHPGITQLL